MKTTAEIFDAYLKCQTKCWLRAIGKPSSGNAYAEWVNTQNDRYRATQTELLLPESARNEVARSPAIENVIVAKWRLATNLIARARDLESFCHAVARELSLVNWCDRPKGDMDNDDSGRSAPLHCGR